MTKLKVLIVEDTQVNLDAAKAFFSTITDYEFVYATNRKDAEKLLEDVYAVITDRSLPSHPDINFLEFNASELECPGDAELFPQANGNWIANKAFLMKKPCVMATQHGSLFIFFPKIDLHECQKSYAPVEQLVINLLENPSNDSYSKLMGFGVHGKGAYRVDGVTKSTVEGWDIAWRELQKQF